VAPVAVLVSVAIYLLAPGGAGTAVQQAGPEDVLDHYKCYFVEEINPGPPAPVVLRDQFEQVTGRVGRTTIFCNPVIKEHAGRVVVPRNRDAHLKCHELRVDAAADVVRTVRVRNQFGVEILEVTAAVALCAPASKSEDPAQPPPDPAAAQQAVDHFKCYDATGKQPKPSKGGIGLTDQFHVEKVKLHKPVALCNPVFKFHMGQVFDVKHREAHLVCYRITPPKSVAKGISAGDQFNRFERLFVNESRLLCVPSFKEVVG